MNPNQSNQQSSLDPMMLQRLIDGELETEQVQRILWQAQGSPKQWESIAVGFIENQAWAHALNSKFADRAAESPIGVLLEDQGSEGGPSEALAVGPRLDPSLRATAQPNKPNSTSGAWWVMAASFLVAASIGYMISQIQNKNLPVNSIAENQSRTNSETDVEPKLTATSLAPDFHVEVPRESGFAGFKWQDSDNRVPVFRVTNADQLKQFQTQRLVDSAFPRRVVEQLSGRGYQIEQEIEFVSGRVDDQSFIVPLRTIRFIPSQ